MRPPENVGFQVRPHWVRMALTRAKSRCMRDALQIGIAALVKDKGIVKFRKVEIKPL